ncbi:Putative YbiA-like superfamily protein [Septoria linicola]|uniref:YbiA-like superfamily protein n=1 Tax=Septoria linicola TaxID=215465 RepID=A0A9Q9AR85_9PEZI|nr:putative YbiA-like superfamily protein [Septoria linicola]USW53079.1 Putative YbiA-like superfamily protein [Septoria linicola]
MMYNKALIIATLDPPENKKRSQTATGPPPVLMDEARRTSPERVLAEQQPNQQKYLVRSISFTKWGEKKWDATKFDVVVKGNYYKFSQNPELKTLLLDTGDRELLEAAPRDRIWGIDFEASDAKKHIHRKDWGANLLGKAQMTVREMLRAEEAEEQGERPSE